MEAVFGLLLMLLRVSHGVETSCDGRQDGAQCYGALGGTVVLQLMDSASEIFRYEWSKNNKTAILQGGKNKKLINQIEKRSSFSDGTFRINSLSRTDSGEYTLQTYDSSGQRSEQRTLQLFIQGVEAYCDGRQDGAQCYGALGGTVVLQLMDSTSEIFRYEWKKNKIITILRGKKNNIVFNVIDDRSFFTPSDGTFRINNLSRTDSGEYTLQTYDSSGQRSEQRTLQLFIQAPVSSVLLVSECLSQGWTRVSCSSEGGDSPQYSWTLDGHTLTDAELLSGNHETNNIILKQDVSGRLVCSVRNHISSVSREENISTCKGVETSCDGRRDGAQCYGALGGTVVLQLMDSTSEIFKYEWKKNKTTTIFWGKKTIVTNNIANRSLFTPSDGTFRINNLSRNDSGEYTLQTYDSSGQISEPQTLQLFIQAPVSSVLLVSECLSQGWTRVSCSSEGGDSPQYSWTLDGHTLTDAELLSGNHETNNIILKQDVSGRLVCSVRNHVSSVSREERISCIFINCTLSNGTHISQWVSAATNTLCIELTTAPTTETSTVGKETVNTVTITNVTSSNQTVTSSISDDPWYFRKNNVVAIAGVLLALVILVLVGVAVICSQKKQKNDKPKEETDEQELTYADVRFMQRQGQQVQKRAEVEVEYGQVKFPQRPRQSVERAGDDCLYAQVHKDR
ncbi:hemicentin-1 isoform X28 [Lates calcarifer]|uniref:Hemicentin-1 isoform X28 n=1 Tax=Lates calcarifer TaxID=8187 RepID=A0AAJ8B9J9_LATCA|nr:hemicentin-1 isoform X28 [Lates calcarifer]